MKFISEKIIDRVAEEIGGSEEAFKEATVDLSMEQPNVAAYIFSDNFDLFTDAEKQYFLFLVLVVFKSIKNEVENLPKTTAEALGKYEEKNWELINEVTSKQFRDRLNIFFKKTPQEDLLAFIEDALLDEEEELITKIGREPMFVALKSIIDSWCDSHQ